MCQLVSYIKHCGTKQLLLSNLLFQSLYFLNTVTFFQELPFQRIVCFSTTNFFTLTSFSMTLFISWYPVGIYLLKVNNRDTRKRCEICSKLTIKPIGVVLVSLLLTLNIFHTLF